MTCAQCGTPAAPGARFCSQCGASLQGLVPSDLEAERRVVTVLFGDLSDFTSWSEELDPERVGVVTDRVLTSLARVVGDYGGYVDKLTGDGIMAVFGAPTAHEDDTERAVRAAAQMQHVVRRLVAEESGGGRRLGLRVGLNTGEVLAGVQAHLSYTVIGDAVNTAARLSDAAGVGAVLAGRDTALSTMSAASWRALAPLRLKGKREPVRAYELVGLRPAGATRLGLGDEAPFVGRDGEFGQVIGRLLQVTEDEVPRAFVLAGEAGVGKTRLAQEVARFAGELPGARVLWGRSQPYGAGRDLAAVADLVRTAAGVDDGDDVDTARERVRRLVARLDHPSPVPVGVADRLQELLGLDDPDPGPGAGVTPGSGVGGDRVRSAVAALFSALAAEGPLLLVLDDMHWATPTMVEGMLAVAEQTRGPVFMLACGRPDMLTPELPHGWWKRLPATDLLTLTPLEDSASERLLRAYLGLPAGELDQRVRDALLRRAQGNPFFLAELLHLLVDQGLLQRAGDRWQLEAGVADGLAEGLLPAGVQAVLAARIDGLDGPAKGVLRDAAVLGGPVDLPALEAVGRASGHGQPEVVAAALRTLVDRRMLEPSPDGGGTLRFVHTLVRDVAYAGLAKAERARRHAAAAAHAVQLPVRSGESDDAAAAHGERAVQLAREMGLPAEDAARQARGIAFAALARLGQAALSRDDNHGGLSYLSRALAVASEEHGPALPDDLLLPVSVAHAQALAAVHRLEEAEAELAPALARGNESTRAAALLVLGEVRRKGGDLDGAREAFVSALAAAGAEGLDRLTGEALRQLGLLDYFAWRLRSAEERFRQAHALAVQVEDPRGAGWALQHLAWSATSRGDYALADEALDDAAEVFSALEDVGGLSWVAGTEGLVRLLQGRLSEARDLAGSVLPLGEAMGEKWGVAALLVIDALAAAELGDVPAAAVEAETALERFREVHDAWGEALALCALSVVARAVGDPALAATRAADAFAVAGTAQPGVASLALVAEGYAHLEAGDLDRAEAAAFRATALLASLGLEPHSVVGAKVLLAQVLRRRGRLEEALGELDEALSAQGGPGLLFPRRQALAHRAGTLLDLGRVPEAVEAGREAVATPAEDVRAQVLALRALGSALRAAGDREQAAQCLREALAVSQSTGQTSEVATTQALLDGLLHA